MDEPLPSGGRSRSAGVVAIRARELRFAYGRKRPLRSRSVPAGEAFSLHVDELTIGRGERVTLYGPSGSGKSTLLDLLAGVLPAAGGSLEVAGTELVGLRAAGRRAFRRRRVGFVFQDSPLLASLDVLENVLFPFRLSRSLAFGAAARERARDLLGRLGLGGRERHRVQELSQGERQRVAIARALVTEPELLLADEPTAGLDPERATSVVDLLDEVCGGDRTLVVVSHDLGLRERFPRSLPVTAWTRKERTRTERRRTERTRSERTHTERPS